MASDHDLTEVSYECCGRNDATEQLLKTCVLYAGVA